VVVLVVVDVAERGEVVLQTVVGRLCEAAGTAVGADGEIVVGRGREADYRLPCVRVSGEAKDVVSLHPQSGFQ